MSRFENSNETAMHYRLVVTTPPRGLNVRRGPSAHTEGSVSLQEEFSRLHGPASLPRPVRPQTPEREEHRKTRTAHAVALRRTTPRRQTHRHRAKGNSASRPAGAARRVGRLRERSGAHRPATPLCASAAGKRKAKRGGPRPRLHTSKRPHKRKRQRPGTRGRSHGPRWSLPGGEAQVARSGITTGSPKDARATHRAKPNAGTTPYTVPLSRTLENARRCRGPHIGAPERSVGRHPKTRLWGGRRNSLNCTRIKLRFM